MLDWQAAMKRQALAEWRDRQVLSAVRMLNTLSEQARRKFDESLAEASFKDTVWDPARFVDHRIDYLLGGTVPKALGQFLEVAASELTAISSDFAAYGEALARSTGFSLPIPTERDEQFQSEDATPEEVQASPADKGDGATKAGSSWALSDLTIVRTVSALGERATNAIWEAGVAAEREIQNRSGLYDRLRAAAAARVATRWMGSSGEPRPVLAQVIDLIDGVTGEARTDLL